MKYIFQSYLFAALLLILILILQAFDLWLKLSFIFWWYDIIEHFLGGVLVVSMIFLLEGKDIPLKFLYILGVVALVGVGWEFFEFVLDRYVIHNGFTYLPGVYEDTLSDLFTDLLGGAVAYFLLITNRYESTNKIH